jgi:hypothetical protein
MAVCQWSSAFFLESMLIDQVHGRLPILYIVTVTADEVPRADSPWSSASFKLPTSRAASFLTFGGPSLRGPTRGHLRTAQLRTQRITY